MSDIKEKTAGRTCKKAVQKTYVQINEFERLWIIENFRLRRFYPWSYNNSMSYTFLNNQEKYEIQLKVNSLDYYPLDGSCNLADFEEADESCVLKLTLEWISGPSVDKRAYVLLDFKFDRFNDNKSEDEPIFNLGKWVTISPEKKKIAEVEERWSNINRSDKSRSMSKDLFIKLLIKFDNGDVHDENDLHPISASYEKSLINDFKSLLTSPRLSDVKLIVADKEFPVHKAILAARSSVFSAMFEHDMLENRKNIVEIEDVEPETMSEMLHYIYTGRVKRVESLTEDLLMAADKYDLNDLNLMCTMALTKNLSIASLPGILKLVDKLKHCHKLRDSILKFVTRHVKEVTDMENLGEIMQSLSPTMLSQVIKALGQSS